MTGVVTMRRAVSGKWLEDLVPGTVIGHAVTRTVTEGDNTLFSAMTMNPQPMHLDAEFAASSEFGERLVNSMLTLALLVGITVYETTLGTTIAIDCGVSQGKTNGNNHVVAFIQKRVDVVGIVSRIGRFRTSCPTACGGYRSSPAA